MAKIELKTAKEVWKENDLDPNEVIEWGYKQKSVVDRMEKNTDNKMCFSPAEVKQLVELLGKEKVDVSDI